MTDRPDFDQPVYPDSFAAGKDDPAELSGPDAPLTAPLYAPPELMGVNFGPEDSEPENADQAEPRMAPVYAPPEFMGRRSRQEEPPLATLYAAPEFMGRPRAGSGIRRFLDRLRGKRGK